MTKRYITVSGLDCPLCGHFIEITLNDFLYASTLRCKACGLVINKPDKSSSLDIQKRIYTKRIEID